MTLLIAALLLAVHSNAPDAQATTTPAPPAAAATQTPTAIPSTNPLVTSSGWSLQCDPVKAALACRAVDDISANGGLIVGLILAPQNDGKIAVAINVPLGVAVRTPITLATGNGPMQTFTYFACGQKGCFANGTMKADLLAAMRASKAELHVSYGVLDSGLNERKVNAALSLTGFSEVMGRLK